MEKRRKNLDGTDSYEVMQFENAKVQSYFQLPNNAIHSKKQHLSSFFIEILYSSLNKLSVITLIGTIVAIILVQQKKPYYLSMYVTQLLIYVTICIIKQFYFDRVKQESSKSVNSRTVKAYRGKQQFPQLQWGELRQGDIVYLTQGQVAPADLLLLDSQQIQHRQAVTYIDIRKVNGQIFSQKKKACYLTQMVTRGAMQKLNWENYHKILSGKVNYQKSHENLESFTGYLKLTKDPKVEKLSEQNLILRQSIIKTSLWVYGLVLYSGMNSKIMKSSNKSATSSKILSNKLDAIFLTSLIVNIILGFTFSLAYLYKQQNRQFFQMVAYHFQMFSIILPHFLYIANNIYLIYYSFIHKEDGLKINNFQKIHSLGEIDIAVLSERGVINSGQLTIDQIVTPSAVYYIKNDENSQFGKKKKTLQRRNASHHQKKMVSQNFNFKDRQRKTNPFSNITNQLFSGQNQLSEDQRFEIDDNTDTRLKMVPALNNFPKFKANQLEPLKITKNGLQSELNQGGEEANQIIRCFALCHQAKFFYNSQKSQYEGTSSINSQQVLLRLVSYVGWQISPKMDLVKQVGLLIKQYKFNKKLKSIEASSPKKYQWIGINNFQISRKLFSVVVKQDGKVILYCKGQPEDIIDRLIVSKQTGKIIESTLLSYKNKKAETIIYAKRQLTNEQKEIYEAQYANLKFSLTTTQVEIQDFSKKWEDKLQFLSIVSLSSQIDPQAKNLVKFLTQSGIKKCIISQNDLQLESLKEIFCGGQKQIQMEFVSFEKQNTELIRYYLNYATRNLKVKQKSNFGLIINDKAWDIMCENSDIMKHFLLILYYSQGLIAYNFNQERTAQLTKKLKNSYPRDNKVLAIGNSYEDLKFEDQADLSISVGSLLPTDINCQNLSKVIKVLQNGPKFLQTYISMITLVLYRIISIGSVVFVFEIVLISYNASLAIDKNVMFILIVISSILELSLNLLFGSQAQKLQKLSYYSNFKKVQNKIYTVVIEAIIHGAVIAGSVLITLPQARLSGGKLLPAEAIHISIFILLVFVSNFRYIFQKNMTKLRLLIITVLTVVLMALSFIISSLINPNALRLNSQFSIVLSNYDSVTMIINTTLFCLAISLFIEQIIKKRIFPDIKEEYSQTCENTDILNDKKNQSSQVDLVRHLFKQEQNVESSIIQLIGDRLDLNALKINKMIQIRDTESNIKNLYQNHKKNSKTFLKTLGFILILQITLIIVNLSVFNKDFSPLMVPFIFGIILAIPVYIYFIYGQIKLNYYPIAEVTLSLICLVFTLYIILGNERQFFLIFCFLSIAVTQILEVRMIVLTFICGGIILGNSILLFLKGLQSNEIAIQLFFTIICVLMNLFILRRSLIQSKINFIINQSFEKETHYVNDILSILVPKFVKQHLQNYTENFALQQKENKVSILFCYVCNFQAIVKQQGKNVVLIMDQLFRQFDQLCHNFAVQKIQTVGVTYMAATGIKAIEDQMENDFTKKNQVQRLLKMSIQMLDKAKNVAWGLKKDKRLNIKIGIHHGDVVIGVIGYHKPQFSLIGDTVNTTSRHCSTGQAGDITLSSIAYQMLKRFSHTSFTKKKKTMKGLGDVNVFVYKKEEDLNSNHVLIKMKFRRCVYKVIQMLKKQGKIKYKMFRAADIAQFMVNQSAQRANSRKFTSNSKQRRSSVNKIQQFIKEIQKQKTQILEGKHKQIQIKHNILLQPQTKNRQYNEFNIKKHLFQETLIIAVIPVLLIGNIIFNTVHSLWSTTCIILQVIGLAFFMGFIYFYKNTFKSEKIIWVFSVFFIYLLVIQKLVFMFKVQSKSLSGGFFYFKQYFSIILITMLSALHGFRFLHMLIITVTAIILSIINLAALKDFQMTFIFEVFCYLLLLFRKYQTMKQSYNNYSQIVTLQKRNKEQSDLVSQLLPKHAYQKLKNQNIQNRLQLTDEFQNCTMLYADIKGFTSFSKKHQKQPDVIVEMLRKLFEQFDKKCLEHNVYKVYTIGDCYVVLGFTNCYQRDILQQAKNVVNMGLAMVQHIQLVREKYNFNELDMRIGIHTGTVIGGIIGTQIVRYDIYGPHVMIANKFEQNGQTGKIHISESTKQILDQDKTSSYNIITHGKVSIPKLNAEYNSYLLSKKKFQLKRSEI